VIELTLPGRPRGKGVARHFSVGGKSITTSDPKTREYETNLYALAARRMEELGIRPMEGPLSVEICAWMPIPKSWSKKKQAAARSGEIYPTVTPDANNISKSLDALNGVCWMDDKQIVEERVTKRYSTTPRLVVRIREIAPFELGEDLPF